MAEGFLRFQLENEPSLSNQFSVASAGISAYDGDGASREATSLMQSGWGIDISEHRSTALSEDLIDDSFLILTMTRSQKDYIITLYPDTRDKTFALKEFGKENYLSPFQEQYDYSIDIPDPYGRPLQSYSQCADEISKAVKVLVEKLKKSR